MADQIAVMNQGAIEQYGTPDAVYHQPATLFVAEFVGEPRMNVLPCTVARDGGQAVLRAESISIPWDGVEALPTTAPAVGIRPQHVRIFPTQPAEPSFPALVRIATPEGTDIVYDLIAGPHTIKVRTPPEMRLAMDSTVFVHFPPQHLHLFDRQSGRRIAPVAHPAEGGAAERSQQPSAIGLKADG
jgi:ABC-type sugar transport system ATPase subunit